MDTPNPYQPPQAIVGEPPAPPGRFLRYLVAGLVALQLLLTFRYSGLYYELVRAGAAPLAALLLGLPSSVCLYVAAVLLVVTRTHGHRLFFVAGLGLALSVPLWQWPYVWAGVAAFGAILGAAGWWVARRRAKYEQAAMAGKWD